MPRHNEPNLRRSSRNRRPTYDTLEESVILAPASTEHPAFDIIMSQASGGRAEDGVVGTSTERRNLRSKSNYRRVKVYSDDEDEDAQPEPPMTRGRDRESCSRNLSSSRRGRRMEEAEEEILDIHSRVRRVRKPTNFFSPDEESNQSFAENSMLRSRKPVLGHKENKSEDDEEQEDEDEDAASTDSDEIRLGGYQRKYSLREHKPTVKRFEILPNPVKHRPPNSNRQSGEWDSTRTRWPSRPNRQRHNRVAFRSPAQKRFWQRRSSRKRNTLERRSSSTSSSSSDDDQKGGTQDRDDQRFNRRTAKSLERARERFLPLNLNPEEARRGVIKDRLRVVGASCSDIDPMSIDRSIGFHAVGGLSHHIQSLKEMVLFPLLYPQIFQKFNISPPRGVVFYGPPGTGKTLLARALANECSKGDSKVAFFMRKGADCLSKWVGESERQLRLLFDQAYTMRPSIIFFDELDGLAPVRSTRQDQIHSSIVSTLLALMDGLDQRGEVVVIGATNRLDSLDPALRRPGRFDRELGFSLPDKTSRLGILKIHTREWEPALPTETLDAIADKTVGFCGADMKGICTEGALIAIRQRYPQIYCSQEKLVLDMSKVSVTLADFDMALSQLVPASQRGINAPTRPIQKQLIPLLGESLQSVLRQIPQGYHQLKASEESKENLDEYQTVLASMRPRPVVAAGRVVLCAPNSEFGQTSHLAPALLHSLDHLTVFSLAIPQIYAASSHRSPEEAVAEILRSASRMAGSNKNGGGGPCVLYLPTVDDWFSVVLPSVWHTLVATLESWDALTSVLLVATAHRGFEELPEQVKGLFRKQESFTLSIPDDNQRRQFFSHVLLVESKLEPSTYTERRYQKLLVAGPEEPRKLSEAELELLRKEEDSLLRQLRIFLREMHGRLIRDRRFLIFTKPVDVEDAPDYYDVIKQPMDLSEMMGKLDKREYRTVQAYLDDIDLITANALEYNPDRETHDRIIRHKACDLSDAAHALIDAELDPEFERQIDEIKKSRAKRGDKKDPDPPLFLLTKPKGAGMKLRERDEMEPHGSMSLEQPIEDSFRRHSSRYSTRSRGPAPELSLDEIFNGYATPTKQSTSQMDISDPGSGSIMIVEECPLDKSGEIALALEQQMAATAVQINHKVETPEEKEVINEAKAEIQAEQPLADTRENVEEPTTHEIPSVSQETSATEPEPESSTDDPQEENENTITPVLEKKDVKKESGTKRPAKRGLEAIWCRPKRRRISIQKKKKIVPRHAAANAIKKKYKTSRKRNILTGSVSGSSQRSSPNKRTPPVEEEYFRATSIELPEPEPTEPKVLVVDEEKLMEAVELAVNKTHGWTLIRLERLGAKIKQIGEKYRNIWDRTGMAEELLLAIQRVESSDDV